MNDLKIYINGEELRFINSIVFGGTSSSPVCSFALSVDENLTGFVYIGDIIDIKLSDESVFKGIIQSQAEVDMDNNQDTAYDGVNLMGFLMGADIKPKKYLNKRISEILNESKQEVYGGQEIKFIVLNDQVISRYSISSSKSLFDVTKDLANEFGMYTWADLDGTIYVGEPQHGKNSAHIFDFDMGVPGYMKVKRSIADASTDVIVESKIGGGASPDQTIFKERYKVGELSEFISSSGIGGSSPTTGGKPFQDFKQEDFSALWSTGLYKTIGCNEELRTPPKGGLGIRRPVYEKISSDSKISAELQYRLLLEKYYPTFEIEIGLENFFVPQLNTIYKIKNTRKAIDGYFLLKSVQIQADGSGTEKTTLKFCMPGHQ